MTLTRRRLTQFAVAAPALAALPAVHAQQLEKVTFALNWRADPSHGGYYQALLDGTYRAHGLDVTIQQGGPQVNNRPLLPVGKIDFLMTGNLLQLLDNAKQKIPTLAVGAIFQKDPQCLISHPGQGLNTWDDLKKARTIFISKDGQFSFWQWMKTHGFRDEQLKPFSYSMSQFLADKASVQQGYAFGEPVKVELAAGFKPIVHLLADHGWSTYSSLIETTRTHVEKRPDMVQRFVDASMIGWNNYLYGNPKPTYDEIKRINPDITDTYNERSMALVREFGIIDSGDALNRGIGAMSAERVNDFHRKTIEAGLFKPGEVDVSGIFTTRFVNKSVGADVKRKLRRT